MQVFGMCSFRTADFFPNHPDNPVFILVEGNGELEQAVVQQNGRQSVHLFRPEVRTFYNIEKIWAVDSAHRGGPVRG